MSTLSKDLLPDAIETPRTIVRKAVRPDLAQIASWPPYDWPNEVFNVHDMNVGVGGQPPWWRRIDEPDRCHYSVILPAGGEVIGVHALVSIDWARRIAANMGVRIAPQYCGQGYGTETLKALFAAVMACGMKVIRLDVAASNARALRCYERCGMRIVGEFWRQHRGSPVDPSDAKWQFALPHMRRERGSWMSRFYWMQIAAR